MKRTTKKYNEKKVLLFILILMLSIRLVFAEENPYLFKSTSTDEVIKSIKIGNIVITPNTVDFICTSKAGIVPVKLKSDSGYYYTQDCPKSRIAPQGDFLKDCVCTKYSVVDKTRCIEQSCTILRDEKNNSYCWKLYTNYGVLDYDTYLNINEYIKIKYTTNARARYDIEENCKKEIELNSITLFADVNVKEGLKVFLENIQYSTQNQYFKIKYVNNLETDIEGGIEIRQTNLLFLPSSTIEILPVTFKKGENEITYKMNNIYGEKDITIIPYIIIKEIDSEENVLNKMNLIGKETTIKTQTIQKRNILNPIQYEPANVQKAIIMPINYRPIGIGLLIMSLLVAGAITALYLNKKRK